MKKKTIIIITSLILVAILVISGIFFIAYHEDEIISNISGEKEEIIGNKIAEPDRIVYRNTDGQYFQFLKGEESYNKIKELINDSIMNYQTDGEKVTDDEIKEIHNKSFIEFDYETISKNYIIQLEDNEKKAIIKLAETGGNVVSEKIKNVAKITKELDELSQQSKAYEFEYEEIFSRNGLESLEYKYTELFKEINYKIYQVKIENYEDYDKFTYICDIAIDEEITEETFEDNVIILTVTSVQDISVEVNIGNIKYTYENLENVNSYYGVHLLKVSRIVNSDCIYNTDLTEISANVQTDNQRVEYNNAVDNLDQDIFMVDYETFLSEYESAGDNTISEEDATLIAEKGFEEAERICGEYDESTQTITTLEVNPNNFFTRKYNEGDETYSTTIEAYVFTREDDMQLTGVQIFIDKKTGKIIGGGAFGD